MFHVGENIDDRPTKFSVHKEAIAQLSAPLRKLMTDRFAEMLPTIWEDVSKETFERFAQFSYTGDYSIPKTEKRNEARSRSVTETEPESRLSDEPGSVVEEEPPAEEPCFNDEQPISEPVPEPVPEPEPESVEDFGWGSLVSKKTKGKPWYMSPEEEPPTEAPVYDDERPAEPEPEPVVRVSRRSSVSTTSITRRKRSPESPRPTFSVNFYHLSYPLIAPRNNFEDTCEPSEKFDPDQSYSNVLLSHASLYVLGDRWLIDSLKALALFKLHKTLCVFQLDDNNGEDIVNLAKYAYSKEPKDFGEGIGALRSLVCQYMATNASVLARDAGFMDLLGEGGQFVKDFFVLEMQKTR